MYKIIELVSAVFDVYLLLVNRTQEKSTGL